MPDLPIYLKRSSVSGKVPTASDLAYGELALNYTDGKLYFKLSNNVIHQIPDRANNDLRYLLQAGGTMTGTLVINELTIANSTMSGALQVRGGLGVGGSIYAADVYSNGLKIEAFNTSTLVAQSVSATTSNFATTSGFAQSFNTSTLVANAVSASTSNYATTSGFAQSFNTSTLVANAVSASTSNYATTSGYAESFNTATLVSNAVSATTASFATTSGYAESFNTSTLVSNAVSATTSNYATTSGYAESFNTSTLVANAVSATTSDYATTSGFALSFNTATLVANAVSATTSNYATTSGYAQSFNTSTLVANAVSATTSNYATTSGYAESFNTATLVANAVTAQSLGTGIINIHNATSSSYYGDGALIVAGGVGIANGLNVYGNTNITGNLSVSGSITGTNISVTVNQVTATSGVFFGDDTGAGALYAGIPGYTPFGQTMFQAAGNFNDYMEINVQNINPGTKNSTDIIASADNVGFNNSFIDMGITGSGWDGSQHYSFGTVLNPNDGYLLVGHNTVDNRGSLVIGTTTSGTNIKFVVAATNASSSLTQVTSESVAMSINPAGTLAISTTTGALVVVGGVGISDSLHAGNIYSNGTLLQNFSTSTLVANAISATTSNYATTSGFALSFNTGTLVANAVSATTASFATTSGFAQSFNTATLVANAVSATTASFATTSGFAQSFNTSTLVANAVSASTSNYATTSGYAESFNTSTLVANAVSATTSNYATTSGFAQSFNTSTLVENAVTAQGLGSAVITISNTTPATSTNSGALQVVGGVGVGGNLNVGGVITATNIYVGTWPVSTGSGGGGLSSVAIQYNGASIGSATTINFATGTTATVAGSVVTVQATAVSGETSSTATTATNLALGASGSIPYQISPGVTAFIGIGSTGTVLQSNGTSATWVTTSSLGISGGGSSSSVSYQTTAAITNNVLTINLTTSTLFNVDVTQTISTVTITNVAATGTISSFILALNNQGTVYSIIWPNTFRWPGGTAPTLTGTLNKKDVIVAYTDDGGSNYYAFISGNNL
jgi:hypothetical protein